jgi:hypothetical protein
MTAQRMIHTRSRFYHEWTNMREFKLSRLENLTLPTAPPAPCARDIHAALVSWATGPGSGGSGVNSPRRPLMPS